jgi:hypothetical protein
LARNFRQGAYIPECLCLGSQNRRLTTFVGYAESEVAEAEARLGVRFPAVVFLRGENGTKCYNWVELPKEPGKE